MALSTVLPVDRIRAPLLATERIAAIEELLTELPLSPDLRDRVRTATLRREDEVTTGIGGGVAIPHARVEGITTPLLALGVAPDGIDFLSIDGGYVNLVFLLVSADEQTDAHLALLSELCGFLNDPERRARLAKASTADEALAIING